MKILFVIPYFIPAYSYGGPLQVCFETARALRRKGYEITVATTDVLDDKHRVRALEETVEGVRIVRFRNVSNRLAKRCNGYLPLGFYSWLARNLDRYDAVHCHDFFTYQNLVVSRLCRKKNVPYIIQPHGALSMVRQQARFYRIKVFFISLFKTALINAKKLIALTQTEKKEILALGHIKEENIEIVPNGIDTAKFERAVKIDLHEKYGIPRENSIIGYIGRLQYIKGVDISLEVLYKLKGLVFFTYLIIGPDEGVKTSLMNKARSLGLEGNVVFTGLLEGDEKLSVLKSCDLCLFMSRAEGLPMTVLECAALGVPQILSSNCNVPEIEASGAGFVFDLDRKEAAAEKIRGLLADKDALRALSRNSIALARSTFDISMTTRKMEDIILKLKGADNGKL